MARWRLTQKHYLNVPGNSWEHKEVTNEGKNLRKLFTVPMFLDPEDPSDCNRDGIIVVAHEGKGLPGDIIFTGPPTPDMEPMDEEAQAISDKERPNWKAPVESLPGNYGGAIQAGLEKQLEALMKIQPAAQSLSGVSREEFDQLKEQLAQLAGRNSELEAQLAEQPKQARRA